MTFCANYIVVRPKASLI